nr:uncharacterized protein CTRU02_11743 [Colletotrichum truncatum]KAF6785443.1 hypothetical protein CTRU02_11743 [Colletotrichum truncatum]
MSDSEMRQIKNRERQVGGLLPRCGNDQKVARATHEVKCFSPERQYHWSSRLSLKRRNFALDDSQSQWPLTGGGMEGREDSQIHNVRHAAHQWEEEDVPSLPCQHN